MDVVESLRMAWRAIRGHKLRSTLTALGVVIGIGAVITFVTLGASLQAGIIGDIAGDQPPVINVWAGPNETVGGGQGGPGFGARPVFTEHDVEQLRAIEGVESVVPYGTVRTTALTYRGDSVAAGDVVATTPRYLSDQEFAAGRNFESGAREAVLNRAAARQFDENVGVGDTLTVTLANGSTTEVAVVGVLNGSGSTSAFEGFGGGAQVYVPTDPFYDTTVESPTTGENQRVYALFVVNAENHEVLSDVQSSVRAYLEERSDAAQLLPDDYALAVRTNEQLLAQIQRVLNQLTGFVTGIAVISLVVGSIGIANIMLVSVTERTREIGIMKAVGAQRRDVLQLFLVEAVVVGVVGAVFGTMLGVAGGWLATDLIGLPLSFPLAWFPIAVGVGVAVGVLAGLYPAWNAARTDPIDALRYE